MSISLNIARAFHAFNAFAYQWVNFWINTGFSKVVSTHDDFSGSSSNASTVGKE